MKLLDNLSRLKGGSLFAGPILVTGAAGFIGFHLASRLLEAGCAVVGIDNLNAYYDVRLKRARLHELSGHANFTFSQCDIADRAAMERLFSDNSFELVLHMAAQAGVRYSLENPHVYVESNLAGFTNILEGCRHSSVKHLVFASSSSVYGANVKKPFSVDDNVDHPVSFYAATKKANELMAHSYAHLYDMPCTGLRFFTVYGPWGRPDMALFLFTDAILSGRPIQVFNHGKMKRDFTYIDDIVNGVLRVAQAIPQPHPGPDSISNPGTSTAPYRIYNIGNNNPVELMDMITILEQALGKKADKKFLPLQPGDVPETFADIDDLARDTGFSPATKLEDGINNFVSWYQAFYKGVN